MRLRRMPMDLVLSNVALPPFPSGRSAHPGRPGSLRLRAAASLPVLLAADTAFIFADGRTAFLAATAGIVGLVAYWDDLAYALFDVNRMRGRTRHAVLALLVLVLLLALVGLLSRTAAALLILLAQVPLLFTLGFTLRHPAQAARTEDSIRRLHAREKA